MLPHRSLLEPLLLWERSCVAGRESNIGSSTGNNNALITLAELSQLLYPPPAPLRRQADGSVTTAIAPTKQTVAHAVAPPSLVSLLLSKSYVLPLLRERVQSSLTPDWSGLAALYCKLATTVRMVFPCFPCTTPANAALIPNRRPWLARFDSAPSRFCGPLYLVPSPWMPCRAQWIPLPRVNVKLHSSFRAVLRCDLPFGR
jgi:hypothetical protein